jgi:hypothetical protein
VLTAFDLDQSGNLNVTEIERANTVLLAVIDVSKAEHKRLASEGCCPTKQAIGTPIQTLASRSYDALKPPAAETETSNKPAAPPTDASSDASSAREPAQGG